MKPLHELGGTPEILSGKNLAPAIGQNAVEIKGRGHVLANLAISGGLHGLFMPGGCSDITATNGTIRNPVPKGGGGYCLYSSMTGGTNERVAFVGFTFEIDEDQDFAQFPARLYGIRDWTFIRCRFINRGKALKASLKLGEGKRVEFIDCEFIGWPAGFGRNSSDPSAYICEDIRLVRCTMDMFPHPGAASTSLKIVHTKRMTVEDSEITMRANVGVLDVGDGVENLSFIRTKLNGGSGLGKKGAATFPGSTYQGVPIT